MAPRDKEDMALDGTFHIQPWYTIFQRWIIKHGRHEKTGVIQRKIGDSGNRPAGCSAGQFFKKPSWGVSRLAKTASPNIFPRGEFFHETQINFHQNFILIG